MRPRGDGIGILQAADRGGMLSAAVDGEDDAPGTYRNLASRGMVAGEYPHCHVVAGLQRPA
jgi:hypothetical protein